MVSKGRIHKDLGNFLDIFNILSNWKYLGRKIMKNDTFKDKTLR